MQKIAPGLHLKFDTSTLSLILANVITIFLAVWQGWDLLIVMWVFWFQSVIIGIFNFFRIMDLKNFSTENFRINEMPVQPTKGVKIFTGFFFLFHYGMFHFCYAIFLLTATLGRAGSGSMPINFLLIFLSAAIFFVNHLFSYLYNKKEDALKKQNIGKVMAFPYARVIPMHLMLWAAFAVHNTGALVWFLILKTVADVIMHSVQHAK